MSDRLPPIPFKEINAAAQPYTGALGERWVGGLKRAGKDFKACCHVHKEKTPSLVLFADGHYHCYGCGAHGDLIKLYAETQNVDIVEAARAVARVVGHPFGDPTARDASGND